MGATATVKITDHNANLEDIKRQIQQAISSKLGLRTTVSIQKPQTTNVGGNNFSKSN